MFRKFFYGTLGAVLAVFATLTEFAHASDQGALPAPVVFWFQALRVTDRDVFAAVIAEDAVIELRDVGISQSKSEFIEALDQWETAAKGVVITPTLLEKRPRTVVLQVCYRFSGNDQLNREIFSFHYGQITGSVQEMIGEVCQ